MDSEEATRVLKEHATRQRISIELTDEQVRVILDQWDDADPREPAEITFYVEKRPEMNFTVAGYRYRGDTCCA
jgi:hypothetical protein